jgi:hypothetical protein
MSLKKLILLAAVLAAPGAAHASVTYDLTLTDSSNPAYSGTGTITLATAPNPSGLSMYGTGQYSNLSFTVDNQTFTAPPGTVSAVEFLSGSFYDITFSETIGTTPNRFTLDTTGGYAFYYNNLQSEASGSITASLATTPPVATPEPATIAVLGAGLAGLTLVRRRRRI